MEKVAIVTGGTRGIGRATSLLLAKKGYLVFSWFKSNKDAAESLEHKNSSIKTMNVDISDAEQVSTAIKQIEKNYGYISSLVNNAGISNDGYFLMMSEKKWKQIIDINLNGTALVLKNVLMTMKINQINGSIVNVASVSGISGQVGQANYSASKGALIALTKTLSKEMASSGIRINVVSPGFIETDMTSKLKNKSAIKKLIPFNRFGKPMEVANVIAFLLGEDASYITGKNIVVDGGMIND